MRIRHVLFTLAFLALLLTACSSRRLLSDVSFSKGRITPNADRSDDVLLITFNLSGSADVSIHFDDAAGNRTYFRNRIHHGPSVEQPYQVYFAGVVDGYTLPGEQFEGFTAFEPNP